MAFDIMAGPTGLDSASRRGCAGSSADSRPTRTHTASGCSPPGGGSAGHRGRCPGGSGSATADQSATIGTATRSGPTASAAGSGQAVCWPSGQSTPTNAKSVFQRLIDGETVPDDELDKAIDDGSMNQQMNDRAGARQEVRI